MTRTRGYAHNVRFLALLARVAALISYLSTSKSCAHSLARCSSPTQPTAWVQCLSEICLTLVGLTQFEEVIRHLIADGEMFIVLLIMSAVCLPSSTWLGAETVICRVGISFLLLLARAVSRQCSSTDAVAWGGPS